MWHPTFDTNIRPTFDQHRPLVLVDLGPNRLTFGIHRPSWVPWWPNLGSRGNRSTTVGQLFVNLWAIAELAGIARENFPERVASNCSATSGKLVLARDEPSSRPPLSRGVWAAFCFCPLSSRDGTGEPSPDPSRRAVPWTRSGVRVWGGQQAGVKQQDGLFCCPSWPPLPSRVPALRRVALGKWQRFLLETLPEMASPQRRGHSRH